MNKAEIEPTATGLAMQARSMTRFEALEARAYRLYVKAGYPAVLWHAEDQVTRNYYLHLAAQTEATK